MAYDPVEFPRHFAQGGVALGAHANDSAARAWCDSDLFLRVSYAALRHANWLWLLWIAPLIIILIRRVRLPRTARHPDKRI